MSIRATFVMEQHLGHYSYYQNLRRFVDGSSRIEANWVEVTYQLPGSLWSRLPGFPSRLRGTLTGRTQVLRGLRQRDYDVALFNTQVPAALGGKAVHQKPYVICTDITPIQYDRMAADYQHSINRFPLINRYKRRANTSMLRGASRLLPWSKWAGESLVADYGVDTDRVVVIPPGIDLETWQPGGVPDGGRLRILFVGGDLYRKGGAALLEAFKTLPAGSADLVLVTRTEGIEGENIRVYNHYKPNSPELIALYQSCHIFALPSKAEAFGISATEASAVGLPVIATRVGGLEEIVAEDETGFLIQPGDIRSLAERLQLLIENTPLRRRMGLAARARAEAYFDIRKNSKRVVDILFELARKDG